MTIARLRATAAVTTARRCAPLLMTNIIFEISSSFDGKFESASTSFTSIALPSTTAALNDMTGLSFTHFDKTFAQVTGSSLESAQAASPIEQFIARDKGWRAGVGGFWLTHLHKPFPRARVFL